MINRTKKNARTSQQLALTTVDDFSETLCSKSSKHHFTLYVSEVESRTQGSRPRIQKKIRDQGQGQPFRGQTLSRPRTGMLEAKAKDQGHKRKCSQKKRSSQKFFRRFQKKKSSQKFFQAISTKKRFPKNFFKRSTKF